LRHALLVAAAQCARFALEQMFDAQHGDHFIQPLVDLRLRHPLRFQRERDVLPHSHLRVERKELEHKGDVALAGGEPGHILAVDVNPSLGHSFQPGNHPQRGGLAAARRPEQRHELAAADGEVHRLHRPCLTEFLSYLSELDFCHI
jgi:hypothetical protein